MPIVVENQPVSAYGAASLLVGQGMRAEDTRERREARNARIAESERARRAMDLAAEELRQKALDAERQRKHDLQLADMRQQGYLDYGQQEQEGRAQLAADKDARAAVADELEYSSGQRRELAKINNAMQSVINDPRLSGAEKEDALRQLKAKRLGIQPMPMPGQKSPWPEGQDVGQTWTLDSGLVVTRTKDGDVKLLMKPTDQGADFGAYSKAWESVTQQLTLPDPTDPTKMIPADPRDVQAGVDAMFSGWQALSGQGQAPPPGPGSPFPFNPMAVGQSGGMPGGPPPQEPFLGDTIPPPDVSERSPHRPQMPHIPQEQVTEQPAPPPAPEKSDWKASVGTSAAAETVRKMIFDDGMLIGSPEVEAAVEKMSPEELDRFLQHPAVIEMALDANDRRNGVGETEPLQNAGWMARLGQYPTGH